MAKSQNILGIDVGGTKVAAGLVDKNYRVSKALILNTSPTDLLGQLVRLIESYQGYNAIGIGMPGTISANGWINRLPNVKNFKAINLQKYLKDNFKVPVSVINDAAAFTLGEARLGSGKKFTKVFGVILGTGIGGGLVVGSLHKDMGSILHRKLPGLERQMQEHGSFVKADQYKPFVKKILRVILSSFNPQVVIFGGKRSQIRGMQTVLENCWISVSHIKVSVKVSKLKHAGIIGAVLPLLKH